MALRISTNWAGSVWIFQFRLHAILNRRRRTYHNARKEEDLLLTTDRPFQKPGTSAFAILRRWGEQARDDDEVRENGTPEQRRQLAARQRKGYVIELVAYVIIAVLKLLG
jgi:hypothetical protein